MSIETAVFYNFFAHFMAVCTNKRSEFIRRRAQNIRTRSLDAVRLMRTGSDIYAIKDENPFIRIQRAIPTAVGSAKLSAVHFRLPVSFFIVRHVVAQGK